MANNLQNFYNQILNLRKDLDINDKIQMVIDTIKSEINLYFSDYIGLCKLASNNLSVLLNENHIQHKVINLKEIFGEDVYEHEFIISYYYFNEMQYFLIDITYSQFLKRDGEKIRDNFLDWPGEILCSTEEGKNDSLLVKGFQKISDLDLKLYLESFGIFSAVSIDELIHHTNQKLL